MSVSRRGRDCAAASRTALDNAPESDFAAFDEHGLPAPQQQRRIRDRAGLIGRVDFRWLAQRTVGEFDGRIKYLGLAEDDKKETLYEEKRREDRLRDAGFEVVRFGWADILGRPAWVAGKVRVAFDRAARRAGRSSSPSR